MMGLYRVAITLLRPIFHLLWNIRYEGRENVPPEGGLIMVSNHRSMLDPFFMAFGTKRQLHFMAKAELFRGWLLRFLLPKLGAFKVERGTGDTSALDVAKQMVNDNKILFIFIEGTRAKDSIPLPPKSGAAMVARVTGGDVLPCAIRFEGRFGLFKRITVTYGETIKNEAFGFGDSTAPASLKRASNLMMDRIKALLGVKALAG